MPRGSRLDHKWIPTTNIKRVSNEMGEKYATGQHCEAQWHLNIQGVKITKDRIPAAYI